MSSVSGSWSLKWLKWSYAHVVLIKINEPTTGVAKDKTLTTESVVSVEQSQLSRVKCNEWVSVSVSGKDEAAPTRPAN